MERETPRNKKDNAMIAKIDASISANEIRRTTDARLLREEQIFPLPSKPKRRRRRG